VPKQRKRKKVIEKGGLWLEVKLSPQQDGGWLNLGGI
jgi:hypothetical protein